MQKARRMVTWPGKGITERTTLCGDEKHAHVRFREHIEGHIGSRSHRKENPGSSGRKYDVLRPVMNSRNASNNVLRIAGRLKVAAFVRKSDETVRIRDVDPFRVGPRRIKRDAEGEKQSAGKYRVCRRLRFSRRNSKN